MESIQTILQSKQICIEKPCKYRWQDTAMDIIKELELEKKDQWIIWTLYKRKGEQALNSLFGEIKQGEIKGNPIVYIKWLLKNNKICH